MATELAARLPSTAAQQWDRETDDELMCVAVHDETHDVKSFTFVSPQRKHFSFEAGQYFVFDLGLDNGDESRCYSVSSSPLRPNAITVTVKRVAGGLVSNWLHDNLSPNMKVRASGPLGNFVRPRAEKYVFLSGGSGITPLMSMARQLLDTSEPADVIFIHAGRTPDDFIFQQELSHLARRVQGFRLILLPEDIGNQPAWPGLTGRISKEFFTLAAPDMSDRIVLCCGPSPFMAAGRRICADLGVPAHNYYEESFDAASLGESEGPAPLPPTNKTFSVQFTKQAKSIEVPAGQTILSCAKKSAVRIPSSCANGICGTCKSKLISGAVDMNHNGGIRQREIDAGFFLPCCSKPLSDLVIDR